MGLGEVFKGRAVVQRIRERRLPSGLHFGEREGGRNPPAEATGRVRGQKGEKEAAKFGAEWSRVELGETAGATWPIQVIRSVRRSGRI